MMLSQHLIKIIEAAWSKETSCVPWYWTDMNPSTGQCGVTALLIQDLIDGDILKTWVPVAGTHYYNRSTEGEIIDLTLNQFPNDIIPYLSPPELALRKDILHSEHPSQLRITERYQLLKKRFKELLIKTTLP